MEFTYDDNGRKDEYNFVDFAEAFSEDISSCIGIVGIFRSGVLGGLPAIM